ncbi:MAG: hypothetical protein ABL958_20125 [Bdellovibrionia bacterium]
MRAHKRLSLMAIALSLLVSSPSLGGEIKKVKANAVVIEGIEVSQGDLVYAVDSAGKKRALIEITKAKGDRAAGKIKKGKAKPGMTVQLKGAVQAPRVSESSTEAQFDRSGAGPSKLWIGAMLGYSMDSVTVGYSDESVATAGSGFSFKGVGDYHLGELLTLRALAGYESLSAKGESTKNHCNNGRNCTTNISYLTFDFIGKFNLLRGSFGLWLGGGIGFAVPLSKDTNILAADSITTANIVYIGLGADIMMGANWFLPLQVDYALFMPQTEVKTNWIAIRTGALFKF